MLAVSGPHDCYSSDMVGEPLSGTISPFITGNENTEFSTARPACIRKKIKADPTTTVNMNLKKRY